MKEAIRIVHLVTGLGQGGAERQLYLLLQGLDRQRFEPLVLVRHASEADHWAEPIRALGVSVIELPGRWSASRRASALWHQLVRLRPKIIQGWTLWSNPWMAVLGRMARIPVRVGSVRCNLHRAGRGRWQRWFCTRGLDCIVANSSMGRRDLLKLGVREGRVEVVFNAVREEPASADLDLEGIRRSWGAGKDELVLATIGNLTRPKNYPLLIEVANRLRSGGVRLKVVVYGEGPMRPELEAKVRQLDLTENFVFCGQDGDARKRVAAADIFVFTSWGEGMANALLEGALAGLPIVTTAVGGSDDVVVDGVSGFVVPVNDEDSFVRALQQLVAQPALREDMGRRARERVVANFSQTRMVRLYEQLYERLLTERGLCQESWTRPPAVRAARSLRRNQRGVRNQEQ